MYLKETSPLIKHLYTNARNIIVHTSKRIEMVDMSTMDEWINKIFHHHIK